MIILSIRTDRPETEIGLYRSSELLQARTWLAHRELSNTLLAEIDKLLNKSSISLDNLEGIVVYKGPGSFTGLRIGASVANALAYSLDCPVVAVSGDDWIKAGIASVKSKKSDKIAIPKYGQPPRTTTPIK